MPPKINGIVFSYNRAMQLDATLNSFYLHCTDANLIHLTVLFKADNPQHARQYQTLKKNYQEVTFSPEKNFRRDTLEILSAGLLPPLGKLWLQVISYLVNNEHMRAPFLRRTIDRLTRNMQGRIASRKNYASDTPYILFLVDDNIFVRDFSISDAIQALESQPDALGFSLRLGKNTTFFNPREVMQRLPSFLQLNQKVLSFAWPDADYNFGYPLEVSSSVYRAGTICPFVASLRFYQPNKLEGQMAARSPIFEHTQPRLLCFETSVTFCNPVNMVQKIASNWGGHAAELTAENLAERFERGERINVKALAGFTPNGCHQLVGFEFTQ
jgi:hypothetical protein